MAKKKSFLQAFDDAYAKGKGSIFTWNNKEYTAIKAEDLGGNEWKDRDKNNFDSAFATYLQTDGANSDAGKRYTHLAIQTSPELRTNELQWFATHSASAGIQNYNPSYDGLYDITGRQVTESPTITPPTPSVTPESPVKLNMFTNNDIRNLGFNNWSGLVNAARNLDNANNPFIQALKSRYTDNIDSWNREVIEKELGVKGKYRSFGAGDFGDMSRSMASYIGRYNGEIDRAAAPTDNLTDNPTNTPRSLVYKPDENSYWFKTISEIFSTNPISSKQQGGQINMNEQELQQAFILFLMQKTGAKTQQELEAVIQQLGEDGLKQAYAEFMQAMLQQQVQSAKRGAQLNYIKYLRGKCPEGYEMQYYKAGGQLCKKCMKKQQEGGTVSEDPVEAFKKGHKTKKACGGVKFDQKGNRVTLRKESKSGNTTTRYWSDGTTSKVSESEETPPTFTGRDGRSYTEQENPARRDQRYINQKVDSLYKADWSSRTAPKLIKRKK